MVHVLKFLIPIHDVHSIVEASFLDDVYRGSVAIRDTGHDVLVQIEDLECDIEEFGLEEAERQIQHHIMKSLRCVHETNERQRLQREAMNVKIVEAEQ